MKYQVSQRGMAPLSIIGLVIFIIGLGFIIYWRFSPKPPMGLICHLKTDFVIDEEVELVRPLASGIQLIQERFEKAKGQAGTESENAKELLKNEDNFIKERLAKSEKKREELTEKRDAIRQQLEDKLKKRNKKVDEIWQSASQDWESAYDGKLKDFKASIAKRAKELKIEWPEKFSIEAPDIYVSAFRLGLYRMSQGQVDKTRELAWAESKLKEWRNFSTEQETKHEEIKGKAFDAQFEVESSVTDLQEQLGKITEELTKEEASLHDIEQQPIVEEPEKDKFQSPSPLMSEKTKLKQELKLLPQEYRVAKEKSQDNQIIFQHLERKIKPGDYEILARAKKDGTNYWGVISVVLKPNQTVEVTLENQHFRLLDAILEDKP